MIFDNLKLFELSKNVILYLPLRILILKHNVPRWAATGVSYQSVFRGKTFEKCLDILPSERTIITHRLYL